MGKFQGSLQDWRRYIDEKTKAVRDQKQGRTAVHPESDPDEDLMGPVAPPEREADSDQAASDEVEAILAKHRAIADEINRVDAPVAPGVPSAPEPPVSGATVTEAGVLEAAAMFARLPHHIQLLMKPASGEVAQNSYKNKFTESREELIMRLLDPQLSLEETARVLNVCPTTVRRYTNRGLLRQERTQGNHRRFRLSNVLEFLDKHGATDD